SGRRAELLQGALLVGLAGRAQRDLGGDPRDEQVDHAARGEADPRDPLEGVAAACPARHAACVCAHPLTSPDPSPAAGRIGAWVPTSATCERSSWTGSAVSRKA